MQDVMRSLLFICIPAYLIFFHPLFAFEQTQTRTKQDTLPPFFDAQALDTFDEMWSGFDPRAEPLEVEVLHQWEQDGVVLRVLR